MKCVSKASISKNVKAIEKQMRGKKGEKKEAPIPLAATVVELNNKFSKAFHPTSLI